MLSDGADQHHGDTDRGDRAADNLPRARPHAVPIVASHFAVAVTRDEGADTAEQQSEDEQPHGDERKPIASTS